ncbi:hypothetical protein STEG23_033368, partial [Scotinomys teguina]
MDGCKAPWEQNPDPLQEEQVRLVTEPSLELHTLAINGYLLQDVRSYEQKLYLCPFVNHSPLQDGIHVCMYMYMGTKSVWRAE